MTSVIIGLLVIAAVWSVYLLPVVFGDRRSTPISSAAEFDRWTHSIAYVQRQTPSDLLASHRSLARRRRRRTVAVLGLLTVASLVGAAYRQSMTWLLAGLFFASLLALYLALLAQMKQRRMQRLEVTHVSQRQNEWDEPQIKVIAN